MKIFIAVSLCSNKDGKARRGGEGGSVDPFAFELYRRFRGGETVKQLSAALHIPPTRIAARIRAARLYFRRHGCIDCLRLFEECRLGHELPSRRSPWLQ
jgi:hypothetical protein